MGEGEGGEPLIDCWCYASRLDGLYTALYTRHISIPVCITLRIRITILNTYTDTFPNLVQNLFSQSWYYRISNNRPWHVQFCRKMSTQGINFFSIQQFLTNFNWYLLSVWKKTTITCKYNRFLINLTRKWFIRIQNMGAAIFYPTIRVQNLASRQNVFPVTKMGNLN